MNDFTYKFTKKITEWGTNRLHKNCISKLHTHCTKLGNKLIFTIVWEERRRINQGRESKIVYEDNL